LSATAYSVTELTALVSDAVAARPELEDLLVEGELSNLKAHASGHLYFTLKDARAALSCVCFRTNALRIAFQPEHGMTVVAHGSVQVYGQQGRYQLYVDRLEPSGIGALALATEQLKKRLASEGLFDERHKRRLPLLPRRVVVVTSRSGAALRDVLTVVSRRAPCIDAILSPATVQGEGAADTIALALRRAALVRGAEVVLLVRGGGSFEDLMPFNSEAVARAIRASPLPVVTGIGHETDTTVADLAADRRAATPSAAAEMVAPDAGQLRSDLGARWLRLGHAVQSGLTRKRRDAERLGARLSRVSPANRVAAMRVDVDRRATRLQRGLLQEVAAKRHRLDLAVGGERLQRAARAAVAVRSAAIATRQARLAGLSPRRTLDRGYSITLTQAGVAVTDARQVEPGARVRTLLRSGELHSDVVAAEPAPADG
jgi:exodeoxyribonuclease VII large subunit